jgi:hypothetical protein
MPEIEMGQAGRKVGMHFTDGFKKKKKKKKSQELEGVPIQFHVTDIIRQRLFAISTTFRRQKQPHYGFWSIQTHSWLTSSILRSVKLRSL